MVPSALRSLVTRAKANRARAVKPRWRLARPAVETLDERVLPSVNANLSQGILSIAADNNPNRVQVIEPDSQHVQVNESGNPVGTFAADQIELITFRQGAVPSTFDNQTPIRDKQLRLLDSYTLTPSELSQQGSLDALLVGDTLTLTGPSGAGFQVSGTFNTTLVDDGGPVHHVFTGFGLMELHTALGDVPFIAADQAPFVVTTAPDGYYANFGAVDSIDWNPLGILNTIDPNSPLHLFQSNFGLQIDPGSVQVGIGMGSDLATGLGAPLNNALPYIYLTATSGHAQFGDITTQISADNPLTVAFDPEDPFLYAQLNEFAVGASLKGYIPYTPTLDLPGLTDPIYGHLYGQGTVVLGDVPATVSGSVVLNLDAQHDGRLLSAVRDNVASYLLTGRVDLDQLAQAACGDLRVGLNGHADIAYSRGGFDMDIPVDVSAAYSPGRLLAHGVTSGDFLAGTPLSFLGSQTTVDVTADISDQSYDVIATVNTGSVNGFNSAYLTVEFNNQGVTAGAVVNLNYPAWSASVYVAGAVQPDGQYRFDGIAQATFAGFVSSADTAFTLTNNGLTAAGEVDLRLGAVTLPVYFTADGYIRPDGQFRLTGTANTNFEGFASADASYILTNNGLTVTGDVNVALGSYTAAVNFGGYVLPNGQYSLSGTAQANFAGFASLNAHYVLANGGVRVDGDVNVPIGTGTLTVHFVTAGPIQPDGQFRLTGTAQATFATFVMANAAFTLTNNGLTAQGNVDVHFGSWAGTVTFAGGIALNGQYSLAGNGTANYAGFVSANAHYVLVNGGLTVDGDVNVRLGPVTVPVHFTSSGYVHADGQFQLTGTAQANFVGFIAAAGHFTLNNTGMTFAGDVDLHLGSQGLPLLTFNGWIHTDGQFQLTGQTPQIHLAGFLGTGANFTLNNNGVTATVYVNVLQVGSVWMTGTLTSAGQFSLTFGGSFSVRGYGGSGTLTLSNNGVHAHLAASVSVINVHAQLDGWIYSSGTFSLTASAGFSVGPLSGGLDFTLNSNGLTVHGHGQMDWTTTVLGARFGIRIDVDASLSIATNGTFNLSGSFHARWFVGFSGDVSVSFHLSTHNLDISTPWPLPDVHLSW